MVLQKTGIDILLVQGHRKCHLLKSDNQVGEKCTYDIN